MRELPFSHYGLTSFRGSMTQPTSSAQALPKRAIGLAGSSCAWYLATALKQRSRALIVAPSRKVAEEVFDDLRFFVGTSEVIFFPGWDTLPLEPVSPGVDASAARLRAIHALCTTDSAIVVASADALLQRIVPPEDIAKRLAQSGKFQIRDYPVLLELVRWRESRVRELNVPRRWLAEDGVLIDLAKIKPTTVEQLQGFRGLSKGEAKYSAAFPGGDY